MITEDHVSFEIAKLLKEKGFDETCRAFWKDWNGELHLCNCCSNHVFEWCHNSMLEEYNDDEELNIAAPTIQMAMKWLREIHNIIITVRLFNSAEHFYLGEPNQFTIDIATTTMSSQKGHIRAVYSTYEEAAEFAIKYCLENLI